MSGNIDANYIAYFLFQNTGYCIFEYRARGPLGGIVQHKFCINMYIKSKSIITIRKTEY